MICALHVLVLQELIKNDLLFLKLWVVGKMWRIAERVFPWYLTCYYQQRDHNSCKKRYKYQHNTKAQKNYGMQDKNDYKLTYKTDLVKYGALNFEDAHEVALEGIGGTMGRLSSVFRQLKEFRNTRLTYFQASSFCV